jgi:hypothetical protein
MKRFFKSLIFGFEMFLKVFKMECLNNLEVIDFALIFKEKEKKANITKQDLEDLKELERMLSGIYEGSKLEGSFEQYIHKLNTAIKLDKNLKNN